MEFLVFKDATISSWNRCDTHMYLTAIFEIGSLEGALYKIAVIIIVCTVHYLLFWYSCCHLKEDFQPESKQRLSWYKIYNYRGRLWLSGKFGAMRLEGCRFESHHGPWASPSLKVVCGASAWNSDKVSVLCRERLWVVVDLKRRYRNSLNEVFEVTYIWTYVIYVD